MQTKVRAVDAVRKQAAEPVRRMPPPAFLDARSATATQRRIGAMADASSQVVKQFALTDMANRAQGSVVQLKTKIKHTVGTIPFGEKSYLVGTKMDAELDPDDSVKGSATTADNYDWMKGIRAYYPSAGVIRGHLLNHDLGGYGVPENLYPISSMANSKHSNKVEQNVKGVLSESAKDKKNTIYYTVEVRQLGSTGMPYESADFLCGWTDQDGTVYGEKIESRLNHDKGWGGKSAKAKTSPSAWRHGKRRGQENMQSKINNDNIKVDRNALNLSQKEYGELRSLSTQSKGISDKQDWMEAISMMQNELEEIISVSDLNKPPSVLLDGVKYLKEIWAKVKLHTKNKTLDKLVESDSKQMMKALFALREARITMQDDIEDDMDSSDD